MSFSLSLDPILNPINENSYATLSGTISGLEREGGEVTLDIDWGDPLSPDNVQQVVLKDDGSAGDLIAGDGIINFSLPVAPGHQYLDDNPSSTVSDTYQIQVDATENFLIGTDAVYVVDVSGSTRNTAQGVSVGDVNGDGQSNTILDAEIAAFIALNQDLINRGLGDEADVSVAIYGESGALLDLDPVTAGVQTSTKANADKDLNGELDVNEALKRLIAGGQSGGPSVGASATNFEAGLQQASTAVTNAGTAAGEGNVIFLSDGFKNSGGVFADEASTIRNVQGQNLRAFGVGAGSSLSDLEVVDPTAQQFTNVQDLLDLFGNAGAGSNQASAMIDVTVNNVAPVLASLSDNLPSLGVIVEGDTLELSANYTDAGTLDSHAIKFDWGDGSPVNTSTGDPLLGATGSASGSHIYNTAGSYTASLTVTDDDTLSDSASIAVAVANKIDLDWKPGSNPSAMKFRAGVVPVAFLGASDFDVTLIDPGSIRFDDEKDELLNGGGAANAIRVKGNGKYQVSFKDVNGDGWTDMVAQVKAVSLGSVVEPNQEPFLSDGQIYALGQYNGDYFFGMQQLNDPIKILG